MATAPRQTQQKIKFILRINSFGEKERASEQLSARART